MAWNGLVWNGHIVYHSSMELSSVCGVFALGWDAVTDKEHLGIISLLLGFVFIGVEAIKFVGYVFYCGHFKNYLYLAYEFLSCQTMPKCGFSQQTIRKRNLGLRIWVPYSSVWRVALLDSRLKLYGAHKLGSLMFSQFCIWKILSCGECCRPNTHFQRSVCKTLPRGCLGGNIFGAIAGDIFCLPEKNDLVFFLSFYTLFDVW